ncbi:MAG: M20/M25/M40 family metallo-hydrolase [Rhodococcus sp.]|nr:M20/M25/M40 family metallo-hydrolase [Rhodococcus sp. (in: high G+C Gram-positive bacteria)]
MAGAIALAGCSSGDEAPKQPVDATTLAESVTIDSVVDHLEKLEEIAADNDGNRAAGTPGYTASADYVAQTLRDKGFDVETPEFEYHSFDVASEQLLADGQDIEVQALGYSPSTGPDGITAPIVAVPADESPGCEITDYDGLDVTGAVVLVERGVCPFADKQKLAAERGAVAAVVVNNEDGPLLGGTLGDPDAGEIPTAGVSKADGETLAAADDVTLTLETEATTSTGRNVIAQTTTGSTDDVVMVGAHLDSVPDGPGINDNGTGVAATLETASQLGGSPNVNNAVRFAFWGAEELGLRGSEAYVESLDPEQKADIALYLNFDMLGSENPGYLAYDGDDSDAFGAGPGPEGSAGIERTFVDYFAGVGVDLDGTDFDGRSDYGPFIAAQIPAGGVFSGADGQKTAEQAQEWGGTPDVAYDRNYHSADDTLANIDREALAQNSAAVAYAVGVYAQDLGGPNGVPTGAEREKARAGD